MHFDLVARPPVPRLRPRRASYLKNRARAPDLAPASARVVTPDRAGGNARSFSPRVRERARAGFAAAGDRSVEGAVDPARLGGCSEKASARARARDTPPRAMGGQPAFSGNTSGRSKGNMYGEAGRGRGQGQRRGQGGGDWKNQKSRLQMAQEEDALEATLGYANFSEGEDRLGWLMNVCAVRHRPPRTAGAPRTRANAKADRIARSREPRTREREREKRLAIARRPSGHPGPARVFKFSARVPARGGVAPSRPRARPRVRAPSFPRSIASSANRETSAARPSRGRQDAPPPFPARVPDPGDPDDRSTTTPPVRSSLITEGSVIQVRKTN